ncbi:hypothetical protein [Kribbella alba]|uniref:hypothetical protein n=1 Tax=Kribbella alba TaxID=190197 RepID=UPI003CD08EC7
MVSLVLDLRTARTNVPAQPDRRGHHCPGRPPDRARGEPAPRYVVADTKYETGSGVAAPRPARVS